MIRTNIIAGKRTLLSTVFGPYEMLAQAGIFWNSLVGEKLEQQFDITLTSVGGQAINGLNGTSAHPQGKLSENDEFELLIVPSEGLEIRIDSEDFERRVAYLKMMHDKGSVIASVCTGTFLLAAAGLLDDKLATTHWALANQFRFAFPKVQLNTDLIVADTGQTVTSGGVTADQDLSMHLIARFCDHSVARNTARCTLAEFRERTQQPFASFIEDFNHGDAAILKCQHHIKSHIYQELVVAKLAEKFGIGPRSLNRRFKRATGHTTIDYIHQLKVNEAKLLLETQRQSFESIAHSLRYENTSFFRRLFKKHVGLSPKDYRSLFAGTWSLTGHTLKR